MGNGPIVRVGDRLSIFDSGETARVMNVAAAQRIPVQRCLLDGGACEASAFPLSEEAHAFMVAALGRPLAEAPEAEPRALAQAERAILDTLEYHAHLRLRPVAAR